MALGMLSRGFHNQLCDHFGLRDERNMARFHLYGSRAHTLGHETLKVRIDGPVFSGDCIEARLRPPGCLCGLAREQGLLERLLDRVQDPRLFLRYIARKVAKESLLAQPTFFTIEEDPRGRGRCWKLLRQRRVILVRIGRTSRNVDQGRDVRVRAGLGPSTPGERGAGGPGGPPPPPARPPGRPPAPLGRRERILYRGDIEARP